jgi:aminoglycoside phosphotransferase (APT) family kinase protein
VAGDAHAAPSTPEALAPRLARWCAAQLGVPESRARVHELRRLAGGSSRETWSFDLDVEQDGAVERRALVLRRDPPGRVGAGESDRGLEFRVVRAAFEAGVPVPRPFWACADADVLGTPFYVMERVPGEALPRRLLRDERYAGAREKMLPQLAEIAVRIHRVSPDLPAFEGLAAPPAGVSPALAELERVSAGIRALSAEPHPVLALAERWLRARLPKRRALALVHGDFRVGNVLFDETGVRAVLDWEISKLGDPVEDLGWLCTRAWRFGNDDRPAGGLGTREALLAAYRDAGGGEVDPEHLRFWEAMGSYKVALVFIQQSWVYLSGRVPSLELAALGRRTAEAEEELVRLMEESP